MNPNGDFSRLTLLRVTIEAGKINVTNNEIDLGASSFGDFYDAWAKTESAIESINELGSQYITEIQRP